MAGEKYTNIGKTRWENANVGVIRWDPEAKAGEASVIDETTGTVYEIGGGGGGGGESDFSTVKVTFSNTGSGTRFPYLALVPYAYDDETDTMSFGSIAVQQNQPIEVNVILYKGKALLNLEGADPETPAVVTGDITDNHNGYYFITGNGTFTAAGAIAL